MVDKLSSADDLVLVTEQFPKSSYQLGHYHQRMGIIPNNTGGFGSVEAASKVFARNELLPLQERLKEINQWLGQEVIRFEPYTIDVQDEKEGNR